MEVLNGIAWDGEQKRIFGKIMEMKNRKSFWSLYDTCLDYLLSDFDIHDLILERCIHDLILERYIHDLLVPRFLKYMI